MSPQVGNPWPEEFPVITEASRNSGSPPVSQELQWFGRPGSPDPFHQPDGSPPHDTGPAGGGAAASPPHIGLWLSLFFRARGLRPCRHLLISGLGPLPPAGLFPSSLDRPASSASSADETPPPSGTSRCHCPPTTSGSSLLATSVKQENPPGTGGQWSSHPASGRSEP